MVVMALALLALGLRLYEVQVLEHRIWAREALALAGFAKGLAKGSLLFFAGFLRFALFCSFAVGSQLGTSALHARVQ